MKLTDALEAIVSSKEIGRWMVIADDYLSAPAKAHDVEAVPESHRLILPILEKCRRDEGAFLKLLQALRTSHPGGQDKALEELLHRVQARVHRRSRARRAAAMLVRERITNRGSPMTARHVEPIARQVETAWNAGLVQTMRGLCQVHPRHALNLEECAQAQTEFFTFVDHELDSGTVPLWGAAINLGRNQ